MPRNSEEQRIQNKQGGHHLPPRDGAGPAMDDTDRNTDKVIKPSRQPWQHNESPEKQG